MEPKKGSFQAWTVWLLGSIFYLYEFFVRVAPGVMAHELQTAFHATGAVPGPVLGMVGATIGNAGIARVIHELGWCARAGSLVQFLSVR